MARFTYTKTVYNFKFTPPKEITKTEYDKYKRFIQLNPNKPLINEKRAEQSHDKLTGFVIFGFILLIIGLIGMFGFDSPQWWGAVATFISVMGILHPIINGGVYQSSKNSVNNFQDEIAFYKMLKDMIVHFETYESFSRKYFLVYGFRYHEY